MVEILHYEIANKNKVIGYVDVRVPINKPTMIIFRKIAHIQSGDRRWFNFPSFQRTKSDGTSEYIKYYGFETQIFNGQLTEGLSEKVKAYCVENKIAEVQNMDFDSMPSSMDELPF
jgi:hypothetical protein